jgi:acyl-CoA synthetase (AMP-forming)/AMP-acid ligase II
MNLAEILHTSAARYADRPAVTDVRSGRSLTYTTLAREAEQVATFLAARGIHPWQRIGLVAPNSLAYIPAAFGLLSTGACLVPLATGLTDIETKAVVDEIEVNGCLSWPGEAGIPGASDRENVQGGVCDGFAFSWIARDAEGHPDLRGLDPAFIRFTSGTTDRSKGVVLSHAATLARVEAADAVLRFTPDDRVLWVLPLAWHFAVTIVAYVRAGVHVLLCPDTSPRAMLDAARSSRASVLYGSPVHFERLANLTPGGRLDHVRLALSTSAPITHGVMERFAKTYGVRVAQAYGLIEAGLPCINAGEHPPGSVGPPVPGYEVAVFDDEGRRLGAAATGEVGVRGAGLFSAYYAPWRRREEVMRDGWFFTGDVGALDGNGALHLQGRKKTVIFVAGMKFFPEEVEACINRFPGIRESRVVGRPHPRLGQVPHAEIVTDGAACDVDALRTHCARALSSYKVPLDFAVVTAVPRTPGGKILRR